MPRQSFTSVLETFIKDIVDTEGKMQQEGLPFNRENVMKELVRQFSRDQVENGLNRDIDEIGDRLVANLNYAVDKGISAGMSQSAVEEKMDMYTKAIESGELWFELDATNPVYSITNHQGQEAPFDLTKVNDGLFGSYLQAMLFEKSDKSPKPDIQGWAEMKAIQRKNNEIPVGGFTARFGPLGHEYKTDTKIPELEPGSDDIPKQFKSSVLRAVIQSLGILKILEKMLSLLLISTIRENQGTLGQPGSWHRYRILSAMLYAQLDTEKIFQTYMGTWDSSGRRTRKFFKIKMEKLEFKDNLEWAIHIDIEALQRSGTGRALGPVGSISELYKQSKSFFLIPGAKEAFVRSIIDYQFDERVFAVKKELVDTYNIVVRSRGSSDTSTRL